MKTPLRAAGALAVTLGVLAGVAPGAHAANLFTLDAHAAKPGRILMNPPGSAPGSALVAWTSHSRVRQLAAVPKVCLIARGATCSAPQTLTIPDGTDVDHAIDGLFPVVGPNNTVTVIGPRDAQEDLVRWTSTNGGPFGPGTIIRGAYPRDDPRPKTASATARAR